MWGLGEKGRGKPDVIDALPIIKRFKYGNVYHNSMVDDKIQKEFSLKEKILRYLIENREKPRTILEISKALDADYKNTFQAIKYLSNLIYKEKFGNTNMVEINPKPCQEIFAIEQKRTKEFLDKNKVLKLIQNDARDLNYPFFIVLIFGSVAKKIDTGRSDLDICIISDNKSKTQELILKLRLLPKKLEIHDFNIKEFESMLETKKENLAKEIIKYNLILYGIENYYNLVSKWMKKE